MEHGAFNLFIGNSVDYISTLNPFGKKKNMHYEPKSLENFQLSVRIINIRLKLLHFLKLNRNF